MLTINSVSQIENINISELDVKFKPYILYIKIKLSNLLNCISPFICNLRST